MAKLTVQEQQEIIRLVEAGKPPLEKYRFLLSDDKRETKWICCKQNNLIVTSCADHARTVRKAGWG